MNKIIPLLVLGAGLLATRATPAYAKAAFQSPEVMIVNSQAIAIVQIERIEPTTAKGTNWTYRQKATARVEQTLKGQLSPSITLLGDENFICARCHFETGRFLVFLKREKAGWAGVNYQISARKIENDRVGWGEKALFENNPIPLAEAISSLKTTLEAQAKAPHYLLHYSVRNQTPEVWWANEEGTTPSGTPMSQGQGEAWLGTLPLGAKVSLVNSCTEENASPEKVRNLQTVAFFRGVQLSIIPAG